MGLGFPGRAAGGTRTRGSVHSAAEQVAWADCIVTASRAAARPRSDGL